MHKQLRVDPKASPPDLEKLLRRLKDFKVNLAGAGGSDVEFGGAFAFAVEDKDEARAIEALQADPAYTFDVVDSETDDRLTVCFLKNEPGQLHKCISDAAAVNLNKGMIIRDVLVGVETGEGILVQVYSEQVRTSQTAGRGGRNA